MQLPDYYDILQLDQSATPEQVWLNFHRLEYLWWKKETGRRISELPDLLEAYVVLSSHRLRTEYDWHYNEMKARLPAGVRAVLAVFFTGFFTGIIVSAFLRLH